jgi:hypothetical protein
MTPGLALALYLQLMAATLLSSFTLMVSHSRGQAMEVLLPRATINSPLAHEFAADMDGRRFRKSVHGSHFEPELWRKAPGAVATELLLCGFKQGWLLCTLHSQLRSGWFSPIPAQCLIGILFIMVRRRGTP